MKFETDVAYERFWNTIPVGKENAIEYSELCLRWGVKDRVARKILQELGKHDNGDNYILIRSGMQNILTAHTTQQQQKTQLKNEQKT